MTDKEIDFITRFVIRFLKENKIITKYRHDFDNYPLFCSRIESFENPKIIRNFNEWLATYIKKSDAIHPFSLQNVFNRGIDKYQLRDKNFWNDFILAILNVWHRNDFTIIDQTFANIDFTLWHKLRPILYDTRRNN